MTRTLLLPALAGIAAMLSACGGDLNHPPRSAPTIVSAAHSVYLQGGVLKVFSDDTENILYLYVRPADPGHWVTSGGGGGSQNDPWRHSASMFWTLADEDRVRHSGAPRKSFSCVFDSRNMTLSVDAATYAVRRGDLVVIELNENWQAATVGSGIESLTMFDLPDDAREQLQAGLRKHYR